MDNVEGGGICTESGLEDFPVGVLKGEDISGGEVGGLCTGGLGVGRGFLFNVISVLIKLKVSAKVGIMGVAAGLVVGTMGTVGGGGGRGCLGRGMFTGVRIFA